MNMIKMNILSFLALAVLFSLDSCSSKKEEKKKAEIAEFKVKLAYFSCDSMPSRIHYRTMQQSKEDSVYFVRYCEDSTAWTNSGQMIKLDKMLCQEFRIFQADTSYYTFIKTDSMMNGVEKKEYIAKEHRNYNVAGKNYRVSKFELKTPSIDGKSIMFWNPDLGFVAIRYCEWCDHTKLIDAGAKASGDALQNLTKQIAQDSVFYNTCN
jgi:hypothetical protein